MNYFRYISLFLLLLLSNREGLTQFNEIDLSTPREYTLAKPVVEFEGGPSTFDPDAIILLAELQAGKRITVPGDAIPKAIKKLWDQKMFSNVKIEAMNVQGDVLSLKIILTERPRLSRVIPGGGARKKEFEEIEESLDLYDGKLVSEDMMYNIRRIAKDYFVEKGFKRVQVEMETGPDTILPNIPTTGQRYIKLKFIKGPKVKIKDITFEGVTAFKNGQLYRTMKETKRRKLWRFWKASKFQEGEYKTDKQAIIDKYNDKGFRDATIVSDTVYDIDLKNIGIKIKIDEGNKYYFRNITWIGNSKYTSGRLDTILGIKKGDVFDQGELESRLYMNPSGSDVTSAYMDYGYLFFSVTPVELRIVNDSIDYEMRITEGKQARVRDIIIKGNTKTNDHIIRREIRTKPGDLFSRNDILRTQRELAQMNYFDPEKMGINPIPDPATGTVDIEYTVEERPSDQVQLSGGWGGGRIIGTLGLTINNFSTKNVFKKGAWQPLPSGDGQQLAINASSTGAYYQGYNISFIEPWLGGKKPTSLSVSGYHTFISGDNKKFSDPEKSKFKIYGASVGLGKRLKWPDDYFSLFNEVSYQYYVLQNYDDLFSFSDGFVNNLAYRVTLSRNSVSEPIYPRSGSNITFTVKATPPYSYFNNKDYSNMTDQERFNMLEYVKLKFSSSHFIPLTRNKHTLVLHARTGFGVLLPWNQEVGDSPFERFVMGGSGLSGMNYNFAMGREIIALRGYEDQSVSTARGMPYIAKYKLELRYPVSLNPSATVFLLGFTEGGKTWTQLRKINPFEIYRSAGVGVRLFLPMFGMLGFDYGWRIDTLPGYENMQRGQFHFTIGMELGEL